MNERIAYRCEGRLSELPGILRFVEDACARTGAAAARGDLKHAVEEVCVNVITHGYADGTGPIELTFDRRPGEVVVTITDEAPHFDPAAAPTPDLEADWESRPLGGLGWHLVRGLMDRVEHRENPGRGNVVTLGKRVDESQGRD